MNRSFSFISNRKIPAYLYDSSSNSRFPCASTVEKPVQQNVACASFESVLQPIYPDSTPAIASVNWPRATTAAVRFTDLGLFDNQHFPIAPIRSTNQIPHPIVPEPKVDLARSPSAATKLTPEHPIPASVVCIPPSANFAFPPQLPQWCYSTTLLRAKNIRTIPESWCLWPLPLSAPCQRPRTPR